MTSNVGFFNGRLGIAKSDPQVAVYINTSDAIKLPSGFTSQRPTGTTVEPGMMRYNSTTGKFEGFSGDTGSEAWGSLGDGSGGGGGGGTSSGATGDTTLSGQTLTSIDPDMSGLMTNQTNVVGGGDFEVMGSGTDANLDIIAEIGSAKLNLKVGTAASIAATIGWNNTLMDFNKPVKINGDLTLTGNLLESDGVTQRAFSNWTNSGGTATSTITRNSAVDITGTITAGIYTTPNADSTAFLGKAKIGYIHHAGIAAFGHRYLGTATDSYAIFQLDTGETAVNSKTGYPLTLRIGNDQKIYIRSDGNIGMGTTSPGSFKLNVNGNTNITGYLITSGSITSSSSITANGLGYFNSDDADTTHQFGRLKIMGTSSYCFIGNRSAGDITTNGKYALRQNTSFQTVINSVDLLQFMVDDAAKMTIKSDGNVGIGTPAPAGDLEISGYHYNQPNTYDIYADSGGSTNLFITNTVGGQGDGTGNFHRSAIRFKHSTAAYGGVITQSIIISEPYSVDNWEGAKLTFCTRQRPSLGSTTSAPLMWAGYFAYNGNFEVRGTAYANGSTLTSDDRVKHNEKLVINALDNINKLNLKKYIKTKEMYDKNHHFILDNSGNPLNNDGIPLRKDDDYFIEVGFIAQDVRNITEFAEFVNGEEYEEKIIQEFEKDLSGEPILDESGNMIIINTTKTQVPNKLRLNYNNLFCYHIQATQELHKAQQADKAEIAELKTKNTALETKNTALETKNTALENKVNDLKSELQEMKTIVNALKLHLGL